MALSGRIPCTTDPAARCVGMEAVEIQGHVHVHQIAVFQGSQILQNLSQQERREPPQQPTTNNNQPQTTNKKQQGQTVKSHGLQQNLLSQRGFKFYVSYTRYGCFQK